VQRSRDGLAPAALPACQDPGDAGVRALTAAAPSSQPGAGAAVLCA